VSAAAQRPSVSGSQRQVQAVLKAEECFQRTRPREQAEDQASSAADDLSGNQNHRLSEGAEVHSQQAVFFRSEFCLLLWSPGLFERQGQPALEIPCQGRHHHVGAVTDRGVQWCSKRSHLFALADDVFLIAPFVGCQHNFFCGLLCAADIGDVKEEGRIIDQLSLTFCHRHLLVKHDHAIGLVAFARRISKLSDEFFLQPLVLVFLFDNHLFFRVGATSSRLF
jgi:hypothetical protein